MTINAYKRLTITLSILSMTFVGLSGWLIWELGWLRVRVAFAHEQIEIFQDMRDRAVRSDVTKAAGYLDYAVHYYPSGTKQIPGSRLDRIVEREREIAVRDILNHLRSESGQDLGDDPELWIANTCLSSLAANKHPFRLQRWYVYGTLSFDIELLQIGS